MTEPAQDPVLESVLEMLWDFSYEAMTPDSTRGLDFHTVARIYAEGIIDAVRSLDDDQRAHQVAVDRLQPFYFEEV